MHLVQQKNINIRPTNTTVLPSVRKTVITDSLSTGAYKEIKLFTSLYKCNAGKIQQQKQKKNQNESSEAHRQRLLCTLRTKQSIETSKKRNEKKRGKEKESQEGKRKKDVKGKGSGTWE